MRNDHLDHINGPKYSALTPAERQRLLDLHQERGEDRLAHADHNLANALRLGAALKQLEG